ncbi:hypothetical protein BDY19DRAFT_914068 [Irpex rosettiformis]|uniref:Uncharacterized protein n=1 Tax=Irpex rosettiformis TaxID=378272 RepID=A0ACB8UJX7_9APHY|nr:hypothetical protein BDY19DRAFT_914068 [Irpex rosettiformis]
MATIEKSSKDSNQSSATTNDQNAVDKLGEALAKTELQEDDNSLNANVQNAEQPARPLYVYKRPELLFLSQSPLVKPPDDMPALKYWFGDWNEQVGTKKEVESSGNGTNTRDRRFRRDADEGGEAPARQSFRSSLSQPSQMGNFRHQSLRTAERDRDRDSERERQRDERDREGQERLRNLSDKYDRERLAASSNSALRGKDRDPAPHLAPGPTAKGTQGQNGTTTRRTDARDTGRKKAGEASDDWRRAAENSRTLRDDRSDVTRRDRDRPRSRVRDSSRPRRDPSNGRRDRDKEDRDRPRRGDDRDDPRRDDDYRRDRDEYFTRREWDDRHRERFDRGSRDFDRDTDEDPRRWRDDGRRDERQARRDRDRTDRGWDRWEPSHDRERVDERDGRSKRTTGRDKRSGAPEDPKEKDERKEKEPAWMETYIPATSGGGILGGLGTDGELDGIQAWKKGMKEREKKDKDDDTQGEAGQKSDTPPAPQTKSDVTAPPEESPLDEIQMFKMMMRKEAAKKESDMPDSEASLLSASGSVAAAKDDSTFQTFSTLPASEVALQSAIPGPSTASNEGARLLSLLSQSSNDPAIITQPSKTATLSGPPSSDISPAVSRLFPIPATQTSERVTIDLSSPMAATHQFNPPAGSRLLAFGSRAVPSNIPGNKSLQPEHHVNPLTPSNTTAPRLGGMTPPLPGISVNMLAPGMDTFNPPSEPHFATNHRATPSDRSGRSYSPFSLSSRQHADDIPDGVRLSQTDPLGRPIIVPHPERHIIGSTSEVSSPYAEQGGSPNFSLSPSFELGGGIGGGGSSVGKGSRFAKFFDAKNREAQSNIGPRRTPVQPGLVPTPPLPGHNGITQSAAETRAMEDLFAMLQNSTQSHRASPQLQQTNRIPSGGSLYGQGPIDIQALQQQQHFAQQNVRLDSLYDSRLDDRNFVPDGLVPGLRPAPRPRSREPTGVLFNEQLDDPLHFNAQRIQQQRALEQLYPGQAQPFNQPGLSRGGITLQQAQLREIQLREAQIREAHLREVQLREAAAIREAQIREAQLRSQQGPPQRLPPGLANLGARPPHDPAQYLNSQLNATGGLLPNLQQGGPAQQRFDGFGGVGSFNGPGGARGPVPGPHHQTPAFNGLGPANVNAELRNQNQILALGGGGLGGNPRGLGPGFPQQQQLQAQQLALRQQQQHLPPQVLQQHNMVPPHIQLQQQNIHVGNTQGTADLMALLMGGPRE